MDEYFSKPLFKKDINKDIFQSAFIDLKVVKLDELLELVQLPPLNVQKKITLNHSAKLKRDYSDEEFNELLSEIQLKFNHFEKEVFSKCLDYYKTEISREMIKSILQDAYKSKDISLETIIHVLFSIRSVLIKKGYLSSVPLVSTPLLNTRQYTITDALQVVRLPKITIKPSYHVLLSDSDITDEPPNLSELSDTERILIETCINYYKGMYPKQNMMIDLTNYPEKLSKIVKYLYKYQKSLL